MVITSLKFQSNIHALRAIAISSVVLFHVYPKFTPNGYLGVDLFFSISGYLIGQILYSPKNDRYKLLLYFIKSRAYRLLPALLITIFLTILASQFFFSIIDYEKYIETIIPSIFFYLNFYLNNTVDYFNSDIFKFPLAHFWSLSLEVQFYLISALIILLFNNKRIVLLFFGILSLISITIEITHSDVAKQYYLPYSRFWQFGIPFILGFLYKQNYSSISVLKDFKGAKIFSFFSFLLTILILFYPIKIESELLRIYIFLSAILSIVLNQKYDFVEYLCKSKPIINIGNISYSLYLYHFPIIVFFKVKYYELTEKNIGLLIIFCSLILSFLSWKFYEKPILNRSKSKSFRSKYHVFTLLMVISFLFTIANFISPKSYKTDFKNLSIDLGFSKHCRGTALYIEKCQNSDKPEILIWGDSYGYHISSLYINSGYTVRQIVRDGCRPTIDLIWNINGPLSRCHQWNQEVINLLKNSSNSFSKVVIASNFNFNGNYIVENGEKKKVSPNMSSEIINKLLKAIKSSNKKTILVIPAVTSKKDVGLCLRYQRKKEKDFDKCNINEISFAANQPFVDAIIDNNEADYVLNLKKLLCKDDICLSHLKSCPIYWDGGHWTNQGTSCFLKYYGSNILRLSEN